VSAPLSATTVLTVLRLLVSFNANLPRHILRGHILFGCAKRIWKEKRMRRHPIGIYSYGVSPKRGSPKRPSFPNLPGLQRDPQA